MAKIEIGVLSKQRLNRRNLDRETMCREATAFVKDRSEKAKTFIWRLATRDNCI